MQKIFTNESNRYHSLSVSEYSGHYEFIDRKFSDVAFSFKGPFDSQNLAFINQYVESAVSKSGGSRSKLFKVFVELAQNIAQNSIDAKMIEGEKVGSGILVIHEKEESFEVLAANPASAKDAETYSEKIEYINTLSFKELRKFRREMLKKPAKEKGNGNIGLIVVAMHSGYPLLFETDTINKDSKFISLQVKVDKE